MQLIINLLHNPNNNPKNLHNQHQVSLIKSLINLFFTIFLPITANYTVFQENRWRYLMGKPFFQEKNSSLNLRKFIMSRCYLNFKSLMLKTFENKFMTTRMLYNFLDIFQIPILTIHQTKNILLTLWIPYRRTQSQNG